MFSFVLIPKPGPILQIKLFAFTILKNGERIENSPDNCYSEINAKFLAEKRIQFLENNRIGDK